MNGKKMFGKKGKQFDHTVKNSPLNKYNLIFDISKTDNLYFFTTTYYNKKFEFNIPYWAKDFNMESLALIMISMFTRNIKEYEESFEYEFNKLVESTEKYEESFEYEFNKLFEETDK